MKNLDRLQCKVWDKKRKIMLTEETDFEALSKQYPNDELYSYDECWYPTVGKLFENIKFLRKYSDRFVFLQSIGLRDKNRKMIYEGDIVEHEAFIDYVVHRNGVFTTERNIASQSLYKLLTPCKNSQHCLESITIVGNIYENPELLNNI